jgi:hypothetical protein
MTSLVEIRNGQQYAEFDEWASRVGSECEAYKAWTEKNPPPSFPDEGSDSSLLTENKLP